MTEGIVISSTVPRVGIKFRGGVTSVSLICRVIDQIPFIFSTVFMIGTAGFTDPSSSGATLPPSEAVRIVFEGQEFDIEDSRPCCLR